MDATELRALQAPLKQAYRDDPQSARTPLSAVGSFSDAGITATIATAAGPVRAGLHRATGGDGSDACSVDILLQALVACAGVTLRSVATSMGMTVRELRATAFFDARGTLGISQDIPVGCQDVRLTVTIDCDAADEALARLGVLTERFCVVGQSLADPPRIQVLRVQRPEVRPSDGTG